MPKRPAGSPRSDTPFVVDSFEPAYLALHRSGELAARSEIALRELEECRACPRECQVNRMEDETKVCQTGRYARVASAQAHFGEEDCLRGWRGSGTIFFSLCNLSCVFCQNWDLSQQPAGRELPPEQIADLMLELQEQGCHNINFVTPEHVAPQVLEAVACAVPRGLRLPIVYNTSGYDSLRSLRMFDGIVDIYMPDFKYWKESTAYRLSRARDYPTRAREGLLEMHRQVGVLRFGPDGVARRGVLVRHLVMPGMIDESEEIFRWLASEVSPDTYVNIMAQYHPAHRVGTTTWDGKRRHPKINRTPTSDELARAYDRARESGLWRFDLR